MHTQVKSPSFSELLWLEHGFGTKQSATDTMESAVVKQIHSNLILVADHLGSVGESDGLVTNRADVAISIRTADCYPILLADSRHRAIAAIHAGWRGTAAHIVTKALEKMKSEYGTSPADVFAAIGPGIGVCCYEVGAEVAGQFGPAVKTHLDLALENRKQLETAGVPPQNIEALGICTFCDTERFFSYRREKDHAGRMTSFIMLRTENPEIKPR
jgi:YfiH family protein